MTDTQATEASIPKTPTCERILDAALDLFIERGVAGTTVSDIERAVGLAAGTGSFYRHFGSKNELVVPAFRRGVTEMITRLDAARVSSPPRWTIRSSATSVTTERSSARCTSSTRCGCCSSPSGTSSRSCKRCSSTRSACASGVCSGIGIGSA